MYRWLQVRLFIFYLRVKKNKLLFWQQKLKCRYCKTSVNKRKRVSFKLRERHGDGNTVGGAAQTITRKVSRDGTFPESPTGFREDFPPVRLCGLKERKVTPRCRAKLCIKLLKIHHVTPSFEETREGLRRLRFASSVRRDTLPGRTFFTAFRRACFCFRGLAG